MICLADARFAASIMMSCSISESFTGPQCVWRMKTSAPRSDTSKRQWISPLANSRRFGADSGTSRCRAMSRASSGCDRPETNSRRCFEITSTRPQATSDAPGRPPATGPSVECGPTLAPDGHVGAGPEDAERADLGVVADPRARGVDRAQLRARADDDVDEQRVRADLGARVDPARRPSRSCPGSSETSSASSTSAST